MTDLSALTVDDFAATVGTPYALDVGAAGTLALVLRSATPAAAATTGAPREPFSLLFVGPADPMLPQATYLLTHPELGELPVFLVPVGRDADGARYEAVFA
ncbi:DUF6916 family protein [Patulibacter americanus]|uniref:DUF6916 family protein n=1 Tax=Patulibacter americanus TaxID=588672 RepID=UPI0003B788ED|nr:hypothetical protein [Patulibacter americanus]